MVNLTEISAAVAAGVLVGVIYNIPDRLNMVEIKLHPQPATATFRRFRDGLN
jgi:hypothetical protein